MEKEKHKKRPGQNSMANANQVGQEEVNGVAVQPPEMQFDAPPIQMVRLGSHPSDLEEEEERNNESSNPNEIVFAPEDVPPIEPSPEFLEEHPEVQAARQQRNNQSTSSNPNEIVFAPEDVPAIEPSPEFLEQHPEVQAARQQRNNQNTNSNPNEIVFAPEDVPAIEPSPEFLEQHPEVQAARQQRNNQNVDQVSGDSMVFTEREVYGNSSDPNEPDMVFTEGEVNRMNSDQVSQDDMVFTEREVYGNSSDPNSPDMVFTESEVNRMNSNQVSQDDMVFTEREVYGNSSDPNSPDMVFTESEVNRMNENQVSQDDMVFTEREVYGNSSDPNSPDMVFTESEVEQANQANQTENSTSNNNSSTNDTSNNNTAENTTGNQSTSAANNLVRQGERFYQNGNYSRAIVFFQRALHSENVDNSHSAQLLYNIGMCNYRMSRYAAAINFFELYLTHNPGDPTTQGLLEECRSRSNAHNSDGAISGTNRYATEGGQTTAENRPESSEAGPTSRDRLQRAERQFSHGDYRSAMYLFEQARQGSNLSASDNADILYNLGMCNLRMRRYGTAITYFEQYLQQNPGNEEAMRHLETAQRRVGIID